MHYAQGRTYYDADSHIMETPTWLREHATPEEAALLGDLNPANAGALFKQAIDHAAKRRADPAATAKLLSEPIISGPKGWAAYGASTSDERSRALDQLGFGRQLVFPTFALGQFARSKDQDVIYAGTHALNRGLGSFCAHDERLMAVGYLPLQDPSRAFEALESGMRAGVRAFWVSADPVGDRSPSHVDHEPIWERLAAAGIPFILHIGAGSLPSRSYHNNGRPRPNDWLGGGENLRSRDFPAVAQAAQNFLTSMVLDGVFQRHERLRCGVIELGGTWVPGFMHMLDYAAHNFRKSEPLLQDLKLKPSEYLRRQVRFSLFPFEDAGWLIRQAGEELFMFASDFPHPEGGRDPIGRFEASLEAAAIEDKAAERFRHRNFADLMSLD